MLVSSCPLQFWQNLWGFLEGAVWIQTDVKKQLSKKRVSRNSSLKRMGMQRGGSFVFWVTVLEPGPVWTALVINAGKTQKSQSFHRSNNDWKQILDTCIATRAYLIGLLYSKHLQFLAWSALLSYCQSNVDVIYARDCWSFASTEQLTLFCNVDAIYARDCWSFGSAEWLNLFCPMQCRTGPIYLCNQQHVRHWLLLMQILSLAFNGRLLILLYSTAWLLSDQQNDEN